MSTITDAIKKRKKEAGEKEVEGLIPVVLDGPDVDVPEERSFRRSAFIAGVVLLVAAAAVSAVILYRGMLGRKAANKRAGAPPRTASLAQPEREVVAPGDETKEVLPLPKAVSGTPSSPAKAATRPPEPPPRPPGDESVVPRTRATTAPGPERPQPVREKAPPVAKSASPPSQEAPPVTSPISPERTAPTDRGVVSKPAAAPQSDPFAGIKLQGIIRFDPAHPEVLINGKALKVGDSLSGIEVVEIGHDSVKLRYGSVEKTIRY